MQVRAHVANSLTSDDHNLRARNHQQSTKAPQSPPSPCLLPSASEQTATSHPTNDAPERNSPSLNAHCVDLPSPATSCDERAGHITSVCSSVKDELPETPSLSRDQIEVTAKSGRELGHCRVDRPVEDKTERDKTIGLTKDKDDTLVSTDESRDITPHINGTRCTGLCAQSPELDEFSPAETTASVTPNQPATSELEPLCKSDVSSAAARVLPSSLDEARSLSPAEPQVSSPTETEAASLSQMVTSSSFAELPLSDAAASPCEATSTSEVRVSPCSSEKERSSPVESVYIDSPPLVIYQEEEEELASTHPPKAQLWNVASDDEAETRAPEDGEEASVVVDTNRLFVGRLMKGVTQGDNVCDQPLGTLCVCCGCVSLCACVVECAHVRFKYKLVYECV